MKTRTRLATALVALATLPLLAQRQPSPNQPPDTPSAQQNPSSPQTPTQNAQESQATSPEAAPAIELTPVNGELISKLDSKTAKTGDSVVVQTKTSVKTPEGTEIPKGSKLVGHVIGAQSSAGGQTSQVAVLLDHVELSGGQSVPVHSQIQSIAPAGGADPSSGSRAMTAPPAGGGSSNPNGGMSGSANSPQTPAGAPQAAPAQSDAPAPGTVVAKTGNIDIRTTSVPGVLLANNAPGRQDPRMTRTSSILLSARQDFQLESGTQMVIGVAASGGGTQ